MADIFGIGSMVGGLLGGALNWGSQASTNAQNERLMRESWGREDTAIQRRAADLKAAGLSPVLAAGQGAQSSAPIQMKAPQADVGQITANALAGHQQTMQDGMTRAQIELINAEKAEKGIEYQNSKRDWEVRERLGLDEEVKRYMEITRSVGNSASHTATQNAMDILRKEGIPIDNETKALELLIKQQYGLSSENSRLAAERIATERAMYDLEWSRQAGIRTGDNAGKTTIHIPYIFDYSNPERRRGYYDKPEVTVRPPSGNAQEINTIMGNTGRSSTYNNTRKGPGTVNERRFRK